MALGAGGVTFESDDDEALRLAADMGADAVPSDFGRRRGRWPLVVDCGTRPEALVHALESTAPEGVLHSVSYYGEPMTPVPLGKLYTRGIHFHTGRVHSAGVLPEVLALLADGTLTPGTVPPTVIPWDAARDHYLDDAVKLVVTR
jgi:alcohol dehydrogenase